MSIRIYDETNPRTNMPGDQRLVFFDNGYGASIVEGYGTYGIELAVLKGNKDSWSLTYDTPLTDDVIGHNSETGIDDLLVKISELEKD